MKASLAFKSGNSDKVYNVQMEPQGSGWVVNFQFGRRLGGSLTAGTKTQQPVSQEEARNIFTRLVNEKMAKGYRDSDPGTPYTGTPSEKQASGVMPQLLNLIDEEQVEALIADDNYCAQEKFDGRNRMLRIGPTKVEGINKLGFVVGIPQPIHDTALRFGVGLLAGEEIAESLHVFDLLELRGRDLRPLRYKERHLELMNAYASMPSHHQNAFAWVDTAWTTNGKRKMLADLRQANAEGIVFKNINAPYMPGRPNSGGPQLKFKFYHTCSAIVSVVNAKRSVGLQLLSDTNELVNVGNVTIPPNKPVPQEGAIVEVRYLYFFPGGSLFQPVYLGPRDDVERSECRLSQLKVKRVEEEL